MKEGHHPSVVRPLLAHVLRSSKESRRDSGCHLGSTGVSPFSGSACDYSRACDLCRVRGLHEHRRIPRPDWRFGVCLHGGTQDSVTDTVGRDTTFDAVGDPERKAKTQTVSPEGSYRVGTQRGSTKEAGLCEHTQRARTRSPGRSVRSTSGSISPLYAGSTSQWLCQRSRRRDAPFVSQNGALTAEEGSAYQTGKEKGLGEGRLRDRLTTCSRRSGLPNSRLPCLRSAS